MPEIALIEMERDMIDANKAHATIALLAGETARLNGPSKWHPGAIIATAAGAGPVLGVAFMASAAFVCNLLQG